MTIGDAVVAVREPAAGAWRVDRLHRPFLGLAGAPRLDLTVRPLREAPPDGGEMRFDAVHGWHVAATRAGWSLTFAGGGRRRGDVYRRVLLDRAWRRGSIYQQDGRGTGAAFPVDFPLEQILFVSLLARGRGAVVHGAGIVHGGRGWLFAGASGAGKSTVARLLARRPGTRLLNDERVVVRAVRGRWWVFGTPWAGTVRRVSTGPAPLAGIFLIRHGAETRPARLRPGAVGGALLARCFHPYWDRRGVAALLATVSRVSREVPCYDLPFAPDAAGLADVLGTLAASDTDT